MPHWLGAPELIIILVLAILIFGVGRIAKIGSEMGKGISEFRKAFKSDEKDAAKDKAENKSE